MFEIQVGDPTEELADQLRFFNNPTSMIPCSECHIGQMHQTKVTYFTWLGEDLVTVPDFPAWVCDICGRLEYDFEALNNLAILLLPTDSKSARAKTAQPSSQQDQPSLTNQPSQTK
jgi:YgiT-type zinc finger domain-containing protein